MEDFLPDEETPVEAPSLDLSALVGRAVDEAKEFIDQELSKDRAEAAEYYAAEPFGTEKEGRSQVISTDVRDTITAILPSILRVFFGHERVVEYAATDAASVQAAEAATAYVENVVLEQDNPGFVVFHSWFKDALLKRLGFVKSYVEVETLPPIVEQAPVSTPEEAAMLGATEVVAQPDGTLLATITRENVKRRIRIEPVPPEEMLFPREARDPDKTLFIAQRRELTKSQLRELGVSEEDIEEAGAAASDVRYNEERLARNKYEGYEEEMELDDASRKLEYVEAYIRVDMDGDGIAELRRVCTLGAGRRVVMDEPVDSQPFSILCPDPEPHTLIGHSIADRTMDIQWVKSHLMRAMNDSLSLAVVPRIAYVEGRANINDILNDEVGAPIRMDAPGMVSPLTQPFVGKEAFPVLEYWDKVKEQRVGMLPANVDADAMQSSTKSAVDATVQAAHQQVEMICRIFAETGVKHLFRRVFSLMQAHFPEAEQWGNLTVKVNVASATPDERKVQVLSAIKETQEGILQLLGPANPLVSLPQYANTLHDMVALMGRRDSDRYFNRLSPDWQPPAPDPNQPPAPDPNMELVKVEAERMKLEHERKVAELQMKVQEMELKLADQQARLELDRQRVMLEDDRARDLAATNAALEQAKIEAQLAAKMDEMEMRRQVEQYRVDANADVAREKARNTSTE